MGVHNKKKTTLALKTPIGDTMFFNKRFKIVICHPAVFHSFWELYILKSGKQLQKKVDLYKVSQNGHTQAEQWIPTLWPFQTKRFLQHLITSVNVHLHCFISIIYFLGWWKGLRVSYNKKEKKKFNISSPLDHIATCSDLFCDPFLETTEVKLAIK